MGNLHLYRQKRSRVSIISTEYLTYSELHSLQSYNDLAYLIKIMDIL